MPLVTEGDIMFMNELALFKYGKSIDQMFEEIKEINAKEEQLLAQQRIKTEQLLAQQRIKTEQLLAQQKAKEEHTIINMHQKLAIDVATIANILNVPTNFAQEVLSKKGLV
jgi:hypothetical protein